MELLWRPAEQITLGVIHHKGKKDGQADLMQCKTHPQDHKFWWSSPSESRYLENIFIDASSFELKRVFNPYAADMQGGNIS